MSAKTSIHSKKYYRVVLETIDLQRETVDSFALKLAMRTRTPLPRVRQVVGRLPRTLKRGLDVRKANMLRSLIEEIGGRARVETYFLTPGESDSSAMYGSGVPDQQPEPEVELRGMSLDPELEAAIDAPGLVTKEAERSGDETTVEETSEPVEEPPHTASVGEAVIAKETEIETSPDRRIKPTITRVIRDYMLLIAAGILMILLTIAIFKQ